MPASGFSKKVALFAEKVGLSQNTIVRKIALDGYAHAVKVSPVDTGRFRASWRVGVTQLDTSVEPARKKKSGPEHDAPATPKEVASAQRKLNKAKAGGGAIFISNNLPYAKRLENGHSKQSQAMVARTIQHMKLNLNKLVAQVRAEGGAL